jgi:polyhydroxyalkanoate synthesis regulator phasin
MKELLFIAVALVVTLFLADISHAGEVDKLVSKLVEKGVLTRSEADALVGEMKQEAEKQKETEKAEAKIPDWVRKTRLYGDLRLRYQYEDRSRRRRNRNT